MQTKRSFLLAITATALIAGMPMAHAEQSSPRVRAACTGDAKRLCPSQKLGSPEMRYCMESRGQSLSRGCVKALEDDGVIPRGYFRR